jgi:hypothetical protein
MRLIRLQSGVLTSSIFTTNLSVALNCKEKTRAALRNLTIQFPEPTIDVDTTNNIFSFKTGNVDFVDLSIQVVIPVGQYTVNTLTEILTLLMNNNLYTWGTNNTEFIDTNNYNFEWTVSSTGNITDGYVINMAFNRTDKITLTGKDVSLTGMTENTILLGLFNKNIADDSGRYNGELMSNSLICRGGWEVSTTVGEQAIGQPENIADSYFFFYFSKNGRTKTQTFFQNIIDAMSVGFWGVEGKYEYKKGGVMVASNKEIKSGDNLKIVKRQDGRILYVITQNGVPIPFEGDLVNSLEDDLGTADLNYFIKVGNDTGKIAFADCKMTPTPNQTNLAGVLTKDKLVQNIKNDFNLTAGASDVSLYFPSLEVRFLLGFDNQEYEENVLSGNFTGENSVSSTLFNNDLIVEILEFPLLAYDGGTMKLRPILDCITSGEIQQSTKGKGAETYELSYSSIYPTFYDFNISQGTQTFSSLTLRITSNNQLLKLNGVITASILVNDLF